MNKPNSVSKKKKKKTKPNLVLLASHSFFLPFSTQDCIHNGDKDWENVKGFSMVRN